MYSHLAVALPSRFVVIAGSEIPSPTCSSAARVRSAYPVAPQS